MDINGYILTAFNFGIKLKEYLKDNKLEPNYVY